MVGRSKPMAKTQQKLQEDLSTAELSYLKAKNQELAKALADTKISYSELLAERDYLQRELFSVKLKLEAGKGDFNNIHSFASACMSSLIGLSNDITNILQTTTKNRNCATTLEEELRNKSFTPAKSTNAVKPMIAGHVIFRPTVTLRRLSEILPNHEVERLEASIRENNTSSNNESQENNLQAQESLNLETEEENDEQENFNVGEEALSNNSPQVNNRLDTVVEEEEEENYSPNTEIPKVAKESLRQSEVPILSGFFTDVRVYMNPGTYNRKDNVTKTRGSAKKPRTSSPPIVVNRAQNVPENPIEETTITNNSVIKNRGVSSDKQKNERLSNGSEVKTSFLISKSRFSPVNQDYDPLEGPSTLLEDSDRSFNKIETMSILGLTPTRLKNNASTPQSPISNGVSTRRSLKFENTTPKKHVTQRRIQNNEMRKGSPKVILDRLSSKIVENSIKTDKKKSASSSSNNSTINSSRNALARNAIKNELKLLLLENGNCELTRLRSKKVEKIEDAPLRLGDQDMSPKVILEKMTLNQTNGTIIENSNERSSISSRKSTISKVTPKKKKKLSSRIKKSSPKKKSVSPNVENSTPKSARRKRKITVCYKEASLKKKVRRSR